MRSHILCQGVCFIRTHMACYMTAGERCVTVTAMEYRPCVSLKEGTRHAILLSHGINHTNVSFAALLLTFS